MNLDEFFEKMKLIQEKFMHYVENENNIEENFENFTNVVSENQIVKNRHNFK